MGLRRAAVSVLTHERAPAGGGLPDRLLGAPRDVTRVVWAAWVEAALRGRGEPGLLEMGDVESHRQLEQLPDISGANPVAEQRPGVANVFLSPGSDREVHRERLRGQRLDHRPLR